jgi:hypothetical protein
MANIDGSWDVTVKSPMGDQKSTLTVQTSGDTFTGNMSGAMGSTDVSGKVDGDTITFQQAITVPMPLTLDFKITASGDQVTGDVGAGGFGSFPLTGARA